MVECKQTVKLDFFQPDVDFDSETNDRYISEKKIFLIFIQNDVMSRRGRFSQIFLAQKNA